MAIANAGDHAFNAILSFTMPSGLLTLTNAFNKTRNGEVCYHIGLHKNMQGVSERSELTPCMHMHILADHVTLQSASQEPRYSSSCFAHNNSRHKAPRMESPTSTKHTRVISNPKRCSFVVSGPPLVNTFVNLCFVPCTSKTLSLVIYKVLYLWFSLEVVLLLAMPVSHKM